MVFTTLMINTTFPAKDTLCQIPPCIRTQSPINMRNLSTISSTFCKDNAIINLKNRSTQRIAATLKEALVTDYTPSTDEFQLEGKVEKIKTILANKYRELGDNVEELVMIDAIQRLGLEYYFEDNIKAALEKHCVTYCTKGGVSDSLYEVALRFRLLRQQGHHVSADVLEKFKDTNGTFKQELAKDIKGLINLFEASQLSTQDDYILDEALEFSEKHLKSSLKNIAQHEAMIIGSVLRYPYHKSLPRLMAKIVLPNFKTLLKVLHDSNNNINDWVNEVQDLAKIDINLSQISQQLEVAQVSRWWKELNLTEQLKAARDNPAKCYLYSMALFPDPRMSNQRTELTKPITLGHLIDDVYDVCATMDEIALFTEAVNRWEHAHMMEGLPNYMKLCVKALHDLTDEQSHELHIKHEWNPKDCITNGWKNLCNACLKEATWIASGQLPSTEDYLKTGIITSGVDVYFVYVFSLLGEKINGKTENLFDNYSEIVTSTTTIFRLWNDIGIAKEDQDGRNGSFIACYMNENKGISAESAEKYVHKRISDAWKGLNKECLTNSSLSTDFKKACLNMARVIPIMCNYDGISQLLTNDQAQIR